jgi:hypothetical protein
MTGGEPPRLVPLCGARIELGELRHVDTAAGRRLVGEIVGSRWEGERLRASQVGSGADWLTYLPDGLALVDVRLHLRTDDGADLLVRYGGRSDLEAGHITTSVLFETGDAEYAWLNRIMAVGRGRSDVAAGRVAYDVYEVR